MSTQMGKIMTVTSITTASSPILSSEQSCGKSSGANWCHVYGNTLITVHWTEKKQKTNKTPQHQMRVNENSTQK